VNGLAIFDIDGTLFRGADATVAAVKMALEDIGLPQAQQADIKALVGKPVSDMHAWLRSWCPPEQADRLVATVDRYELDFVADGAMPYPGVIDALTEIRTFAAEMAICTNGPQLYVERVLEVHGLGRFFDRVRFHRAVDDTKVQMVRELLAQSPARPAVVVGDRHDDVQAAHANQLRAVAVNYGYGNAEELSAADVTVTAAMELPEVLRNLFSPSWRDRDVW